MRMNSDTITATMDNQQTHILVTEPLIPRHATGQETEPVHSTSHPQVYTGWPRSHSTPTN
jgi:hypothetical protein